MQTHVPVCNLGSHKQEATHTHARTYSRLILRGFNVCVKAVTVCVSEFPFLRCRRHFLGISLCVATRIELNIERLLNFYLWSSHLMTLTILRFLHFIEGTQGSCRSNHMGQQIHTHLDMPSFDFDGRFSMCVHACMN